MNNIPEWWLIVSGIFFALNTVLIGILIFAVLKVLKTYGDLEPKIHTLTTKVDSIAGKVDEISTQARNTLAEVSGKTKNVAGSAESIANVFASNIGKYAPIITGLLTAIRIVGAYKESRGSSKPAPKKALKQRR